MPNLLLLELNKDELLPSLLRPLILLIAELEIFENCSHNVHLEKSNEFNILVEKFINQ